jgi:hypothetical protein
MREDKKTSTHLQVHNSFPYVKVFSRWKKWKFQTSNRQNLSNYVKSAGDVHPDCVNFCLSNINLSGDDVR